MKPLKLEAGKSYHRKNWDVRTIETAGGGVATDKYGEQYLIDGHYCSDVGHWMDLIAEVPTGTVMVPVVAGKGPWAAMLGALGKKMQSRHYQTSMWEDKPNKDYSCKICEFRVKPKPKPGQVSITESEEQEDHEGFVVGRKVIVFDRYRFAISLKGVVVSLSTANDGVEVRLAESNSNKYPIGCVVWVSSKQLRQPQPEPEPQPVGWKEAEAWMGGGGECECEFGRLCLVDSYLHIWTGVRWEYTSRGYNALQGGEYILLDKTTADVEREG